MECNFLTGLKLNHLKTISFPASVLNLGPYDFSSAEKQTESRNPVIKWEFTV